MKFFLAFAAVFIGCATAASPLETVFTKWTIEKDCPEITDVKSNFDVKAFLGKWYNPERYGHAFEMNSNCSEVEYSLMDDGSYLMVTDGLNLESQAKVSTKFSAVLSNPTAEPLTAQFNVTVFELERVNYILDTDYTNYAISYDCQSVGEKKSLQLYWLLSRTREVPKDAAVLARIAELKAKYIDEKLVKTIVLDPKICKTDE